MHSETMSWVGKGSFNDSIAKLIGGERVSRVIRKLKDDEFPFLTAHLSKMSDTFGRIFKTKLEACLTKNDLKTSVRPDSGTILAQVEE